MLAWQARRLAKSFVNVGRMCSEDEAKSGCRAPGNPGSDVRFGADVRGSPSAMDTRVPSERDKASFGNLEPIFKKYATWMKQRLGPKDPKLFQASADADAFDLAKLTDLLILPAMRGEITSRASDRISSGV